MQEQKWFTTAELAEELRITPKTIRNRANRLGVGIFVGGRTGFRFSLQDREILIRSMRVEAPVPRRRRPRRSARPEKSG